MKTMITTITLAPLLSLSHWVEANAAPGVFLVAAKPGIFAIQAAARPGVFSTALDLQIMAADPEGSRMRHGMANRRLAHRAHDGTNPQGCRACSVPLSI